MTNRDPRWPATARELAAAIGDQARLIGDDAPVTGVVYDSRLVAPGFCFAALVGADLDGHDYAAAAVTRGASLLLVERSLELPVSQIVVPDSRAALAPLAAAFYGWPSREIGVIGVTGTDGKTSTSYLIDAILRDQGFTTGMIGTVAIRIGEIEDLHSSRQTTPESVDVQGYLRRMVDAGARWATLEATSHGLAMHRLDGVEFDLGAVTNITHEHLEYHKTIANYRLAKAILFQRTRENNGVAVVNLDDEGAREMLTWADPARALTYSMQDQSADLVAADIQSDETGSTFLLQAGERGAVHVHLPMLGAFNIANALCATGVVLAAGVSLTGAAASLAHAPSAPGRMKRVDEGQPFSVIVDYAHTPDSLAKVLSLLRRLHPIGRLIAVFGSAGERDVEKRAIQGAVSARLADVTIATSEDPRNEEPEAIIAAIAAGAREAGAVPGETLYSITDRRQALAFAFALAKPGDCVLLAGKGHEGSIIWGREKLPWNEEHVARELLRQRFAAVPDPE